MVIRSNTVMVFLQVCLAKETQTQTTMTSLNILAVLVTVVSFTYGGSNKTVGYYEYKYSLQRDLLEAKEKEFSRVYQKLTAVKLSSPYIKLNTYIPSKHSL